MSFFLIILGIYTAMNSYLLGKVWFAFPQLGGFRLAIAAFVLVMTAGPVLMQFLERGRWFRTAECAAPVVYVWMAMVFWFAVLMLVADLWNLLAWSAGFAWPAARSAIAPAWGQVGVVGVIVVIVAACGLWEAQDIRLRTVTIHVPALPDGRDELRIVQLADLHLGLHVGMRRLDKIVGLVERARPDIIVSTGDLLDSPLEEAAPMVSRLAGLRAPLGKFAIFGNHEFYIGTDVSAEFHRLCGFDVLRQRSVAIGRELLLVGVDDAGRHFDGQGLIDENAVLPPRDHRPTTVFLKHQPRIDPGSLGRFDIQLSGHTHGGQIFPFSIVTRIMYEHFRGLYDLGQGSKLYVSAGAGTWGPPIRLFAQPEVTLIILTTKNSKHQAPNSK